MDKAIIEQALQNPTLFELFDQLGLITIKDSKTVHKAFKKMMKIKKKEEIEMIFYMFLNSKVFQEDTIVKDLIA